MFVKFHPLAQQVLASQLRFLTNCLIIIISSDISSISSLAFLEQLSQQLDATITIYWSPRSAQHV